MPGPDQVDEDQDDKSDDQWFGGRDLGAIGAGVRVIRDEMPGTFAVLLVVAVIRGLVPPAIALLMGRAVAAVPGAVQAGGLGGEGRPLLVALVAIVAIYAADQVVEQLVFAFEEAFAVRLAGRVAERTMLVLTGPPLLDHLLDEGVQRQADLAARQEWPHIGPFATNLLYATTWLVGAVAQAVLVATFSVPLAVVTAVAWFALGSWIRRTEMVAMLGAWDRTRRAQYFRRLALEHRSAGEVRVFGLGRWLVDRFDAGWHAGMAEAWRMRAATGRKALPVVAVLVAGNAAGVAYIAWAARRGELDLAQVATVVTAFAGLAQLATPQSWTEPLLWGATRIPALVELEEVARREVARVTPPDPVDPSAMPAEAIRFEGVRFSYPGRDAPVLDGVDLVLERGRSLAVVGVNGAGKTTLVKLLARLHDPEEGRVTVDGVDLRALDPVAWQRRVAAIFQDFARYPLPVTDNVTLAPLDRPADRAALVEVATSAGAAEVVDRLPRGWDTILSRRYQGGVDLSGGEWQRIALARAVQAVRDGAGVLVLDEPTANLDARGEAELFDHFIDLTRGTTTLLISHRFSTVRRADRIVVLDAGRVVESGTHDELVAAGGRSAGLFALQADRFATREEV